MQEILKERKKRAYVSCGRNLKSYWLFGISFTHVGGLNLNLRNPRKFKIRDTFWTDHVYRNYIFQSN